MNRLHRNESANFRGRMQRPGWVLLSLALVALVGVAAYSNSFDVPFTFDDEQAIATNDIIKELSRFSAGHGLHYNPRRILGYLTLALNYRYNGLDVFGYHLVNLAIHLATAFLVYALAALTLRTPSLAPAAGRHGEESLPPAAALVPLAAALLFVAHPIQTQAVTYIVQRFASLATMFYLAAVVCYAQGRLKLAPRAPVGEGDPPAAAAGRLPAFGLWFPLAALASVCALLTKEISFTLPAALLLYDCSFFGVTRQKLSRLLWGAGILGVGGGLFLLASLGGLSTLDSVTRETISISRGDYFLTQLTVIVRYLGLMLLPVGQQVVYDYPVRQTLWDAGVLGSALLLGSLLALSGWLYLVSGGGGEGGLGARGARGWDPAVRRLLRVAAFGILWFFLTLSVESGVIPIRDVIFEHRLYLPSAGLFLALTAAGAALAGAARLRLYAGAVGALVLMLALASYQRNQIWRDPVTLWRDNADKAPGNVGAWQNLGVALHRKGDYEGAIKAYKYCLLFKEIDPEIYNNLGAANASLGRLEEALTMFRKSLRAAPWQWSVWLNVAGLDIKTGDLAAAEQEIGKALELAPRRMEVHYHLGNLYQLQGRHPEAERKYREAIALDPSYAQAWRGLGNVIMAQGRGAEAAGYLARGAELERQGGDIYYGVGR